MAWRIWLQAKPITADENFNIGSLTKQFTAYALLDLYYQGKCFIDRYNREIFQTACLLRVSPRQPDAQPFIRICRTITVSRIHSI